ncbi:prolyl 4-hydroxylase subunit alpha-1 [Drosophila tropicalis]|uniref:prolyl 4-hydroxylase subunit alpha-1 n=1 Tax=Drosophila tropicalis TaxID=46794 RepID=UPI0035AC21EE
MSHRSRCMFSFWQLVLLFLRVLHLPGGSNGEFYSSVDTMQGLAYVEKEILDATHVYVKAQEEQLNLYRNFVEQVKREHAMAIDGMQLDEYVGHPLHAFRLLKRMVTDWNGLHELMVNNKVREDYRQKIDQVAKDFGYPDQTDIQGAVKAFNRLQEVYNLTANHLADGIINGKLTETELEWRECFEIGVQLFDLKQYERSLEWFKVAFRILIISSRKILNRRKFEFELMEYMAIANFQLGNAKSAGILLDQILKEEPTHSAQQTRKYLLHREMLSTEKVEVASDPTWHANYTRLCQGHRLPEPFTGKSLRCYLDAKRHFSFILAPLKVEQVHLDPDINVYHGVLNDAQIDKILQESDEMEMRRSAVSGDDGGSTIADLRVSQQTWLNYSSPVMRSLSNLISDISGFDMGGAEHMQVANYGVGGQYEPHPDYFEVNLPNDFKGDRISTTMFYLSDVELGGNTVFVKLNVFLPPIKGAMVMWHNLHYSLDVDRRTIHAGCPVLIGSKRIGNVWIHSGYQEFRRPCLLTYDEEKSLGYRD